MKPPSIAGMSRTLTARPILGRGCARQVLRWRSSAGRPGGLPRHINVGPPPTATTSADLPCSIPVSLDVRAPRFCPGPQRAPSSMRRLPCVRAAASPSSRGSPRTRARLERCWHRPKARNMRHSVPSACGAGF
ncbi:hypothetical protein DFH09DRAFT_1347374 [Mycena vulgaris]|nr:hypothetical protein DFH09DRAFT_1347374 [Mycena vulgaris]